ncbi:DUF262 domain-containing protein [Aliarcobacter cryaerophilus]|uniref:DUF262 domain-containing protein n=1 Tax=Aliarcobacter cryaerophilus TaxID=28198 RepID=UPI0021B66067|nr:DUF262 domain-containing protein [Aliarcobacter cryaerophilus]MCT7472984.1 DUF262 domain-containing protein [Aliarcobacter cryaerophilus]
MKNNRYTFWKLLDENSIEIPIIQRDYAQGRIDENKIRDKFLDVLYNKIENIHETVNLDFVYGRIIHNKLIPLDGQQRLTTLFLLHWYLATKENKFGEASEKLQKFTYETRISSREFCKALTTNKIDLLDIDNFIDEKDEKISNIIEDKNWFFKSWKKDPTIKSMLNMLDAIHEKFKNSDKLFDKLICENNPPITFDFLPLNEFKLTDELYVKMNARGKPLTLFENFKAEFEKYIEDDEIKSKLDNDWLDIFWNKYKDNLKDKESETLKKIDESYLNFFNNITLFFAIKEKCEDNEYKIKSINDFDIFKYKYNSEEINHISNVFDKIKEEKFLIEFNNIRENLGVFDNFIKEYSVINYEERMIFYIYYKLSILKEYDDKSTKSIIRVCINIVNNTVYNTIDDFRSSINQIDVLFERYKNINEFLKNYNPQHNISEQLKEEKDKAILILENEEWEKEILEAEKNWYLDGQIWFLLEFAENNLEKFVMYRDKFVKLWCLAKDDKKQNLIQRALLVKSDYTALNSRDYLDKYSLLSFGTGLREKNENWRRVFKDKLFKAFLDNLDFNNIENSLKEIINSFKFDCTNWISFIINPNKEWHILDGIKKGHFLKKDNNIFLNAGKTDATSWGWSRVAELKNYYIYAYLKNNGFEEVVEEKLKQEIKLEYYASSEPKDVCFYFVINYDKKDLGINIEFDTEKNKYIFDIFDRNSHEELQRLYLKFELCKDKLLNNLKDIQEEIIQKIDNVLST